MKIDANKIGVSSAISFGVLWIICSGAVHFFPQPMMAITGHMMHVVLTSLDWALTFSGFLIGLIAWSALAGVSGWLIATIYNRL